MAKLASMCTAITANSHDNAFFFTKSENRSTFSSCFHALRFSDNLGVTAADSYEFRMTERRTPEFDMRKGN
jgi:hypothetical protein